MKIKSVLLLAVAAGCGLVAMLGVQQVLSGDKQVQKEEKLVRMLTAIQEIPPGTPLDETNTVFKDIPKAALIEGAVTEPTQFLERALTARAVPGEVIMLAKLGEKGVFGASSEIPEGMRVVTVSVNPTKTHSGLIRPGDRVDVLVTYKMRSAGQGMISRTRTVLEYIRVFATDNLLAANSRDVSEINAKNISLLVDPEQAHLLMLAESKGELHLSLRHKGDTTSVRAAAVDDSIFDSVATQVGRKEEEIDKELRKAVDEPGAEGDLRQFLENEQAQADQTDAVALVQEPKQPKWKISIYAGDTHRIEEVDLLSETAAPPGETTSEKSGSPGAGKTWQGWLQQLFDDRG